MLARGALGSARSTPSRGALHATFALLAGLAASRAAQAIPTARLEYERGADTESCPDEPALRRAVAERLGYDPFDGGATQTLHARLDHGGDGFSAVIQLRDPSGQIHAERRLEGTRDCAELASAMALSMSIVIDPERALERTPHASPNVREAPPPNAPRSDDAREPRAPTRATPATPPPERVVVVRTPAPPPIIRERISGTIGRVGASAHVSLGLEPAPALGFTLSSGWQRGPLSFALEARYDARASQSLPTAGTLRTEFFGGTLVPCYHRPPFVGCALLLGGALRAESRAVPDARADAGLFFAAGGRAGLEWPLSARIRLLAQADLLLSLRPLTVRRNSENAWESSLISGRVASGVLTHF